MPPVSAIQRLCPCVVADQSPRRLLRLPTVLAAVLLVLVGGRPALADEPAVTVAVASNFRHTAGELADAFLAQHGHRVVLTSASTGALYAQVVHGAPFDVLLAADSERPRRLVREGRAVDGSRFTYARGALVLWSAHRVAGGSDCLESLTRSERGRVAIANPRTAPYGAAAQQTLERLALWESLAPRLVTGENVGQAMAFAATGNATFALLAAAQLPLGLLPETGCSWVVPADFHAPIDQQAVLLARGRANPGAAAFLEFLRSDAGRRIIVDAGYRLP